MVTLDTTPSLVALVVVELEQPVSINAAINIEKTIILKTGSFMGMILASWRGKTKVDIPAGIS
jgi:hypothetical protein